MYSINLYELFTEFITFSTVIYAAALGKLDPVVGITLSINMILIWTTLLILYEIGSILENAHAFGLKIAWIQNWLRVFERNVGDVPDKDDQENNVQ
ncbi:phage holin family protein [Enterococcus sp. DIV0756]|uniref:phage holin family protein n=1 Tax=Enterococcus sp. DIV0756 TaxID=2774636 RepID=UPI003F685B19